MFLLPYPLDTCQPNFKTQVFFQTRLRIFVKKQPYWLCMWKSKIHIRILFLRHQWRLIKQRARCSVSKIIWSGGIQEERENGNKSLGTKLQREILENGEQIVCLPIYTCQTYEESFQMNFPGRTVSHSPIDCWGHVVDNRNNSVEQGWEEEPQPKQ